MVLEKTLESSLDSKEIKLVNPEYSLERLTAGGEGDDRGQDGWNALTKSGHEFEQTLGDGEGQGSLECCSPWGRKESDTT